MNEKPGYLFRKRPHVVNGSEAYTATMQSVSRVYGNTANFQWATTRAGRRPPEPTASLRRTWGRPPPAIGHCGPHCRNRERLPGGGEETKAGGEVKKKGSGGTP